MMVEKIPTSFQNIQAICSEEKEGIDFQIEDLIDTLDDQSVKELLSVVGNDYDKIIRIIAEETNNVINLRKFDKKLTSCTLQGLPALQEGYEVFLRKKNLAYFVFSVLPEFELAYHTLEWFSMIQLYPKLCIIAARDHCFGADTPVLMANGQIKKVQNIQVGEQVMGPDSKPRTVLSLHKGQSKLYRVNQSRGDSYIVNDQHILSLYKVKQAIEGKKGQYKRPFLQDMPIEDYLSKSKDYKNQRRGYKVCIDYPKKPVLLEPYYLGLWLGDGNSHDQGITSADLEIIDYLKEYANKLEYSFRETQQDGAKCCWITIPVGQRGKNCNNKILSGLRHYNLPHNKHIPEEYLLNSREVRLQVLAGMIDTDGNTSDNIFYYTTINKQLSLDLKRLADSLGFRTCWAERNDYFKSLKRNYTTYQVTISGLLDQVPVKLPRKKVVFNHKGSCYYKPENFDGYDISIISGLKIEEVGFGDYYGFEIDGDHRFCLGDNTVVHNSKSYVHSFAVPLWRLYRYQKPDGVTVLPDDIKYYKEGMIITNEYKLAKKLLKKVKEEIKNNSILNKVLYPDANDGVWANESIACKNGAEITLSSYRTSNRGPHPGWITVDDFLDRSAMYSKEQRESFKESFNAEIMNMILPQGQILVVGCVNENTLILSKNEGFLRIGQILQGVDKSLLDLQMEVLDKDSFVSTSKFWINGTVQTRKITTKGGFELECSLIHPLWRMNPLTGCGEWVKSSQLQVGDWVALKSYDGDFGKDISLSEFENEQRDFRQKQLNLPSFVNEDLAYLFGLFIAEGNFHYDEKQYPCGIEISSGDIEVENFLFSLKKYNIVFKTWEKYTYTCYNKNLFRLFEFVGFNREKAQTKRIPETLLSLKKDLLKILFRGLFDGDGTGSVQKDGRAQIGYYSASEELVKTMQNVLMMGFGIKSFVSKNKKIRGNFAEWTLFLHSAHIQKFLDEIGFGIERKRLKNFAMCKNLDFVPFQNVLLNKINKKFKDNKYKGLLPYVTFTSEQKKSKFVCKKSLVKCLERAKQSGFQCEELTQLETNANPTVHWMQIKGIEESESRTMDFVIPSTHSFVSNSFVSHNTPFHERDLYYELKQDPNWRVFEYPAVFPDGSVLYSNRYNFEALKAKRLSLGPLIFSREILVRPISDSTSIFPWSILEKSFVGMKDYCLVSNRASFPVKFRKVSIGIDWALSATVAADNTEMTVLGEDERGELWLLQEITLHGASYHEQILILQSLNTSFSADVIVAEVNGFQKVMSDLAKEVGLTNIIEETTNAHTKKDFYEGLPSIGVLFDQGRIHFPRGDEKSIEKTNEICSQLNSVAFDEDTGKLESVSEHDDKAMSLFLAVKGCKSANGVFRVGTTF